MIVANAPIGRMNIVSALLCAAVVVGVSSLHGAPAWAFQDAVPSATDRDGEERDNPRSMTAEDVLRRLRSKKPRNPIILPIGASDGRDKKPQLLPEGTPIVSALGRPVRDGDSWLFVFEGRRGEPPYPPMPLLRNTWLEVLVPDDPTVDEGEMFILSGEVTTYRNRNYLLANAPMRASRQGRPEAVAAAVPSGDPLSERSADEVLKIMQAAAPETPVVWGPSSQALPVIGRPGRLIRDDTWWTFVFESDHPEHAEPRLRILPSQLLEMMADQVEAGATGLVFVVSGDVTEYRGDRYLLTRSAMGRPEMGNLSK